MRSSVAVATVLAAGCGRAVPPPAAEVAAPPAVVAISGGLAAPVRVEIDGPLESGSPALGDVDGDGSPELVMGGEVAGRLLVMRIGGTPTAPRLGGPQWFDDRNPTGRIPKG